MVGGVPVILCLVFKRPLRVFHERLCGVKTLALCEEVTQGSECSLSPESGVTDNSFKSDIARLP